MTGGVGWVGSGAAEDERVHGSAKAARNLALRGKAGVVESGRGAEDEPVHGSAEAATRAMLDGRRSALERLLQLLEQPLGLLDGAQRVLVAAQLGERGPRVLADRRDDRAEVAGE